MLKAAGSRILMHKEPLSIFFKKNKAEKAGRVGDVCETDGESVQKGPSG